MMEKPLGRRAWVASLVASAGTLAAACTAGVGGTEVNTPEGRVLQWEDNDLLVLVSGVQQSYQPGQTIRASLVVNNQSARPAQVKLRTKLLGRGDQAVAESEVAQVSVAPLDARTVDRELALGRSLPPGEYTLAVEVPPWKVGGRDTGRGTTLRARVQVEPPN